MAYQPESTEQYKDNQIIITANRLSFVGKKDSILMFANQSVGISANNSINFDTDGKIIAQAKKIELGKDANEALILGTKYNRIIMSRLLDGLSELGSTLSEAVNGPTGTPNVALNIAGVQLKGIIASIKKMLPDTLSKISFTK